MPLGGKWRQLVGKVGEWYVASRHLKGCSPRLCRLRIDGFGLWLNVEWRCFTLITCLKLLLD
jgi:hypothetical protein